MKTSSDNDEWVEFGSQRICRYRTKSRERLDKRKAKQMIHAASTEKRVSLLAAEISQKVLSEKMSLDSPASLTLEKERDPVDEDYGKVSGHPKIQSGAGDLLSKSRTNKQVSPVGRPGQVDDREVSKHYQEHNGREDGESKPRVEIASSVGLQGVKHNQCSPSGNESHRVHGKSVENPNVDESDSQLFSVEYASQSLSNDFLSNKQTGSVGAGERNSVSGHSAQHMAYENERKSQSMIIHNNHSNDQVDRVTSFQSIETGKSLAHAKPELPTQSPVPAQNGQHHIPHQRQRMFGLNHHTSEQNTPRDSLQPCEQSVHSQNIHMPANFGCRGFQSQTARTFVPTNQMRASSLNTLEQAIIQERINGFVPSDTNHTEHTHDSSGNQLFAHDSAQYESQPREGLSIHQYREGLLSQVPQYEIPPCHDRFDPFLRHQSSAHHEQGRMHHYDHVAIPFAQPHSQQLQEAARSLPSTGVQPGATTQLDILNQQRQRPVINSGFQRPPLAYDIRPTSAYGVETPVWGGNNTIPSINSVGAQRMMDMAQQQHSQYCIHQQQQQQQEERFDRSHPTPVHRAPVGIQNQPMPASPLDILAAVSQMQAELDA